VIVGAGFGGLAAARTLADSPVDVVLIDRNNYHTFLPLLYQVAAAEIEPEEIAYPVRNIVSKSSNVRFTMKEVMGVDLEEKVVKTNGRPIPYDYLVLATGTSTNFFGIQGAQEHSFPLKTLEEGVVLRNHILCCFEHASDELDKQRRIEFLTFVIVGGGSTGIEFAGSLSELIRGPLRRDYPGLDASEIRIVLLEATNRLLTGQPEKLSKYTLERLRKMGVQVRLESTVDLVTPEVVRLQNGDRIPTKTVVWTAGVSGEEFLQWSGLPVLSRRQVKVSPTLQLSENPEVYAIGDLAFIEDETRMLPMIAPVAIQEGVAAGRNISRQVAGLSPLPFRYRDRGTMATIGRGSAVANLGGRSFTGFFAWMLWLVVHLINLIGFRNRLLVLINWAWDYFLFERAVRLILPLKASSSSGESFCGQESENP